MGLEDSKSKALADRKARKDIFVCLFCFAFVFLLLLLSGNHDDIEVTGVKRKDETEKYDILAEFEYEGQTLTLSDELTILPKDYEEEEYEPESEDYLTNFANKLMRSLNNDSEGDVLILPSNKDGVNIKWFKTKEKVPYWILVLGFVLCVIIYFSRYDAIKKEDKRRRAEFSSELPNMILQFILMLNAGLISESAFEELIDQNKFSRNYLYKVLNALLANAKETNASFLSNMYAFSHRFGDRDFVRFATLCTENANSGSELSSKLEAERLNSWGVRVSRAKAKAKEAETKLCFPLMLLLISLVVICITPAIIEI